MCMQQLSFIIITYDKHVNNKFVADRIIIKQQQHGPIVISLD